MPVAQPPSGRFGHSPHTTPAAMSTRPVPTEKARRSGGRHALPHGLRRPFTYRRDEALHSGKGVGEEDQAGEHEQQAGPRQHQQRHAGDQE